jgi:hypothetical protein
VNSPSVIASEAKQSLWRYIAFFLLLCVLAEGCGPQWRRKFIRKRKVVNPPAPILVLQSETQAIYPPDVRYREHFAFWKSWHSDLVASLGKSQRRDLTTLTGTLGELRSMRELLTGAPADRLSGILEELSKVQESWSSKESGGFWSIPSPQRTRLTRLQREIDKKFHYSKIKNQLVAK